MNEPSDYVYRVFDSMRGIDVGKFLMVLTLVESGKITIDEVVKIAEKHHSAEHEASSIRQVMEIFSKLEVA